MTRRVHLIGIAGTGLSAIAKVLHERGDVVTGSDARPSEYSRTLEDMGVPVSYGHRRENVTGAELVIVSSAIPADNVELLAAQQAGVRVVRRREFLGELTQGSKTVAIAGSHGKTTTTGLIAWILDRAGLEPSFIAGAMLPNLGSNGRAGSGPHFVIEADEYGLAFLGLHPSVGVVTNVEYDHPDYFPSVDDFRDAFVAFVRQVQELLVVCEDDQEASRLGRPGLARRSYGLSSEADWRAEEIRPNPAGGTDFLAMRRDQMLGLMRTRLPGVHNVRNVLAALAVADFLGVDFKQAREAVVDFQGMGRRFEVLGEAQGIVVVDDYGHHPTQIRSTLAAARMRFPQAVVWAVFQPHTYSRTAALLPELKMAFKDADQVIVLGIYAAREKPDQSVDGRKVAQSLEHPNARFIPQPEDAADYLLEHVQPGSVVISLSAGDGNEVVKSFLQGLQSGREGAHDE